MNIKAEVELHPLREEWKRCGEGQSEGLVSLGAMVRATLAHSPNTEFSDLPFQHGIVNHILIFQFSFMSL